MLRQVYITQNKKIIYKKEFGKALNETNIDTVFSTILTEASKVHAENIYSNDFFKYRVTYLSLPNLQILIVFVADLSDEIGDVEKEITKCKKEFLGLFEPFLEGGMELDDDSFDLFNPVIDSIHKSMRPKISLVGFSGK